MIQYKIVVFKSLFVQSDYIIENNTVYLNSNKVSREKAFELFKNQWLIFFDADCEYDSFLIQQMSAQLLDPLKIYAGYYKNPIKADLIQKTHNYICNTWLDQNLVLNIKDKFLGGFFVIYSSDKLKSLSKLEKIKWGGEDYELAQKLIQLGFVIENKVTWQVTHNTSSKMSHFIKRSFVQGYNKSKFHLNKKESINFQMTYWFRNLKKQSVFVIGFCVLHFLILKLGEIFPKTHLNRKM